MLVSLSLGINLVIFAKRVVVPVASSVDHYQEPWLLPLQAVSLKLVKMILKVQNVNCVREKPSPTSVRYVLGQLADKSSEK